MVRDDERAHQRDDHDREQRRADGGLELEEVEQHVGDDGDVHALRDSAARGSATSFLTISLRRVAEP